MRIVNTKENLKIDCQIVLVTKDLVPKKKDGWSFNWLKVFQEKPKTIFAIIEKHSKRVHGVIQLIKDDGMLIMELIELSPFNFGSQKKYKNVAGCLIAFGCRESLKLNNPYRGYLTFVSKTHLVDLYTTKYYATQTIGTRMYIDPIAGQKLIKKYLNDEQ